MVEGCPESRAGGGGMPQGVGLVVEGCPRE